MCTIKLHKVFNVIGSVSLMPRTRQITALKASCYVVNVRRGAKPVYQLAVAIFQHLFVASCGGYDHFPCSPGIRGVCVFCHKIFINKGSEQLHAAETRLFSIRCP